jgi:hypothetical protein
MAAVIEQRVDRLEDAIQAFVTNMGIESNKVRDAQLRNEMELRAFKESIEAFKQAIQADTEAFKRATRADTEAFKQATQAGTEAFKQATQAGTEAFKQATQAGTEAFKRATQADTKAFKRGTQATLDRMDARFEASERRMEAVNERAKADAAVFDQKMEERFQRFAEERREMNRQWGNLANKMGTIVEDRVLPSLPRVVEALFHQPIVDRMIRRVRAIPGTRRSREYDAIVVTPELVCVNSTKSTLRLQHINQFVKDLAEFREYFQEYQPYPLIGILASLSVDQDILKQAEETGFVVLATGDELMDIINSPGFVPKRW